MDVLYRVGEQQFVWDAAKANANQAKHGVRFETACEVFFDPFVQGIDASAVDEVRDAAIGESRDHKLLFVVHILREDEWIRVISARPATTSERKIYDNGD